LRRGRILGVAVARRERRNIFLRQSHRGRCRRIFTRRFRRFRRCRATAGLFVRVVYRVLGRFFSRVLVRNVIAFGRDHRVVGRFLDRILLGSRFGFGGRFLHWVRFLYRLRFHDSDRRTVLNRGRIRRGFLDRVRAGEWSGVRFGSWFLDWIGTRFRSGVGVRVRHGVLRVRFLRLVRELEEREQRKQRRSNHLLPFGF
jgi:hypothetical protein